MKYAIRFYQNCRVLNKADEVIINYNERNPNLIKFVDEKDENQRYIADITNLNSSILDNLEIFDAAKKTHFNFAILCSKKQDWSFLMERNIKFFFAEAPSSYDELSAFIRVGVSDVYITGEMGFNLEKISNYCHSKGVEIRVYPNVAQSSIFDATFSTDSFKNFFIRPEDVSIYDEYVDTFEFFGSLDKQPVLYDIYNDERWYGDLNEIILSLTIPVDNMTLVPYFGLSRVKCEKRCNFDKCHICDEILHTGELLKEKEILIKKNKSPKKREEDNNEESGIIKEPSEDVTKGIDDLITQISEGRRV